MAKTTQPKQHTYGAAAPTPTSNNLDISKLEEKIAILEDKLNQKEANRVSLNISSLPSLLPRRETEVIQRVDAIENRLEELIKLLAE
jgi:hypothetical protein